MADTDSDWHDVFARLYSSASAADEWMDDDQDEDEQHGQVQQESHPPLGEIAPEIQDLDLTSVKEPYTSTLYSRKRLRETLDLLSPPPNLTTSQDIPTKRRRIVTSFRLPLPTASSSYLRSLAPRPATGPSPKDATPPRSHQDTSKFSPYSLPLYHRRLLTYGNPEVWTDKPAPLSAMEAARCGWVSAYEPGTASGYRKKRRSGAREGHAGDYQPDGMTGQDAEDRSVEDLKDKVRCELCGVVWKVGIDQGLLKPEFYNKAVKMMSEQFVLAHKKDCLWRLRQCPPNMHRSLLSMHRLHPSILADTATVLDQEYIGGSPEAVVRKGQVSLKHELATEEKGHLVQNLRAAAAQVDMDGGAEQHQTHAHLSEASSILAFFGWAAYNRRAPPPSRSSELSSPAAAAVATADSRAIVVPDILHCALCDRKLGLWTFRRQPTPNDKTAMMAPRSLDVLHEHKPICPLRVFGEGANGVQAAAAPWWSGNALLRAGLADGLALSSAEGGSDELMQRVKAMLQGVVAG